MKIIKILFLLYIASFPEGCWLNKYIHLFTLHLLTHHITFEKIKDLSLIQSHYCHNISQLTCHFLYIIKSKLSLMITQVRSKDRIKGTILKEILKLFIIVPDFFNIKTSRENIRTILF